MIMSLAADLSVLEVVASPDHLPLHARSPNQLEAELVIILTNQTRVLLPAQKVGRG